MMHQKPPQKLELTKSKITRLNSPHSFITIETNSNVGLSNHGNIVSSVSNSQSYNFWVITFNQSNHVCLLTRRDSAANDGFASFCNFDEITIENWILKYNS